MSAIAEASTVEESAKMKKKIAAIGASSLLLLAVAATVATVFTTGRHSSHSDSSNEIQASMKSIQSICQPTDYREQCESSLTQAAGNTTNPNKLVQIAFSATIEHIRSALKKSETLQAAEKDPRTSKALKDCRELFDYAIDDLRNSIDRIEILDITKIDKTVDDLKIWLSAVVTYQETCIDGFENASGNAAVDMKKVLQTSAQLTSNCLAIIDSISEVLTSFKLPSFSRRLLSSEEEGPSWVNPTKRMLLESKGNLKPDLVVAQDGSGDYKTIGQALEHVNKKIDEAFVIYVKNGVYKENVVVGKSLTNLTMYGDGPTKTRITGSLNYVDGTPTFRTATFAVVADGFIAKDMGFENTAGPEKHQAVALRVQSDRSVFYNCHMDGYQDTLYAHTKRQFYRNCTISGTIDFIFGDAASLFQNCIFVVRKPMDNQQTIVTAQGLKERREASGIVLHNCMIRADTEYAPFTTKMRAYLGRPWKEFSRTVIMQSEIGEFISPEGWLPWEGEFGLKTCLYTEFDNRGPGSSKEGRVKWKGIKNIDYEHAQRYTVEYFLQGNDWVKETGVPYIPGLLPLSEEGRMH